MNGTDLLLLVNTATPEAPMYEVVGSQRDATLEETTAAIDVSSKDGRAARVIPGRFAGTISLDALYVPDDAAYLALQAANRAGDLILVARQVLGVVTETVEAVITSISEKFPDQDAAVISVALTIDGQWAAVGS